MWRRRTPVVLQVEAAECGAAALASVLAFHGCHVPLAELRRACAITRDGSRAANVVRAARSHGLEAQGLHLDLQALAKQRAPLILFWEGRHFLILEGLSRRHAWLNDPASGRRRISFDEFRRGYSGIVLAMQPGAAFRRRRAPLAWLAGLALAWRSWPAQLFALCAGLLALPPLLALLPLSGLALDAGQPDWWAGCLRAGGAMMAGALLLLWLLALNRARLGAALAGHEAARLCRALLGLAPDQHAQRHATALGMQVAAALSGAQGAARGPLLLCAGVAASGCAALASMAAWPLMAALAALQLLCLLAGAEDARLAHARLRFGLATLGAIARVDELRLRAASFLPRWRALQTAYADRRAEAALRAQRLRHLPQTAHALAHLALLAHGAQDVFDGGTTVGGMLAQQAALAGFAVSLQAIAGLMAWRRAPAPQLPALRAAATANMCLRGTGVLTARQLQYGWGPGAPVVDGVTLSLRAGQLTLLEGPSGSGKSTLARLLCGLLAPSAGEVRWNGVLLEGPLPQAVAWIGAQAALFSGTVRENLLLGAAQADEAGMVRAAQDACLHELLAARPGGYDAPVGAGGILFSGGERQRIAIARALLAGAQVVVLDEATAALDRATEAALLARLRRRGCAVLLVTQRGDEVHGCDVRYVMAGGRVVARSLGAEAA